MTATSHFDIETRIKGWMADQAAKEDPLGADELGYHTTMVIVQGPKGTTIMWFFLMTIRAPFLGQQPIGANGNITANIPPEAAVRQMVTSLVSALRVEAGKQRNAMIHAPGLGLGQLVQKQGQN